MKIINQSFEIIDQPNTEVGLFKHIEKACRTCYKSEDKITDTSYQRFLNMIRSNGHLSPWEHGTVYMAIPANAPEDVGHIYGCLLGTPWTKISSNISEFDSNYGTKTFYVTTNYRAIIENHLEDFYAKYKCEPTDYHEKRVTVKFITSIGISRELNRHRCHSICEESTRYCGYHKDKFGGELTFITPLWFRGYEDSDKEDAVNEYANTLKWIEDCYMKLIYNGFKAQEAREILPLCTKTEVIHTAFISDWQEFFKLRCSNAAHPMIKQLADGLKEEFIKRKYISE